MPPGCLELGPLQAGISDLGLLCLSNLPWRHHLKAQSGISAEWASIAGIQSGVQAGGSVVPRDFRQLLKVPQEQTGPRLWVRACA